MAVAVPDSDASTSVCDWLTSLGLAMYTDKFTSHRLTRVDELLTLSRGDLHAVGVNNPHHLNVIVGAIDLINAQHIASTTHRHQPVAGLEVVVPPSSSPRSNTLHSPTAAGLIDRV